MFAGCCPAEKGLIQAKGLAVYKQRARERQVSGLKKGIDCPLASPDANGTRHQVKPERILGVVKIG